MKRLYSILSIWFACTVCTWPQASFTVSVSPALPSNAYIAEVLQRAGFFFDEQPPGHTNRNRLLVLVGEHKLTDQQRRNITSFVENGGALVSLSGLHGMQELFGAELAPAGGRGGFGASSNLQLGEGYLDIRQSDHPVYAGLKSSLHFFGGLAVHSTNANATGTILDRHQRTKDLPVLLERRIGRGIALLIAPDLLNSIVHIQQGIAARRDGIPSFDGTMPINDNILKTDDGQVLDYDYDRVTLAKGDAPGFLYPVADELRLLILRTIQYAARAIGQPRLQIAPWPREVPAVGCISHDSDGNLETPARAMLQEVKKAGIRTTWCTMFPCGYPRSLYDEIRNAGCEIALHYDAMKMNADQQWGFEKLVKQLEGLKKESGITNIIANKNHYTRWEGRLDFFRWCEKVGLKVDGTMGPSKSGGWGFPRGTCQPWRPLDDETGSQRFLDVYEIPLITQDLNIHLPAKSAPTVLDQAVVHGGLAHFLFHPAHIQKSGIAEALQMLVMEGRKRGMEWWTHAEVWQWETARRSVRITEALADGNKLRVKVLSGKLVKDATLIVHEPDGKQRRQTFDLPESTVVEIDL